MNKLVIGILAFALFAIPAFAWDEGIMTRANPEKTTVEPLEWQGYMVYTHETSYYKAYGGNLVYVGPKIVGFLTSGYVPFVFVGNQADVEQIDYAQFRALRG